MSARDVLTIRRDALAAYHRAAEVRRDFALVERMAAAHERLGHEDTAIGEVSEYLAGNPRSVPASLMLGHLLARNGDEGRASALLSHARVLSGGGERPPRDRRPVAATLARLEAVAGAAELAQR